MHFDVYTKVNVNTHRRQQHECHLLNVKCENNAPHCGACTAGGS